MRFVIDVFNGQALYHAYLSAARGCENIWLGRQSQGTAFADFFAWGPAVCE
jgi:hypothetical protein